MHRFIATLGFAFFFGLLFVAANAPLDAFAAEEAPYSEQELRSYAFANAAIRLIRGQLDRQLLEAQGNTQATQMAQSAAQDQMSAAIERAGLTAADYEEMGQVIAANAELTATLQEYIDEEMGIIRGGD